MKKLLTKKDIIFIICLVAIGFAFSMISYFSAKGEAAVVRYNGETVEKIDLSAEYYERKINGVTVVCEDGSVYIKDSSCPDKVCVRSGKLSNSGESAVCVPNKVSVEIVGKSEKMPDAITG